MARTRFAPDLGLTTRMTTVMFLLGGLFVAIIVGLMFVLPPSYAPFIGLIGLGIAWWQWYNSDTVAMKAMRAREVSAQDAPELYGMVQRLCTLADMPMPRVGVADTDLPNAFATGRSPKRAVVVVTTGILHRLAAEELEGVLAHELSHVAHRDVLVMTVASSAGIIAGMAGRGAQYGAIFGGDRRDRNNNGLPVWLIVTLVAMLTYAISFVLIRTISRYREYAADRGSALITGAPEYLMSTLQKISSQMTLIPNQDLRQVEGMSAFFIIPARARTATAELFMDHPPLEKRLAALAAIAREMGRPVA